jgi:uncharacterized membrane protein YphA (DoxX/SURF4 family)
MLQSFENPVFLATLLLAMFILSGYHKLITFPKTVDNFQTRINLPISYFIYQIIILLVIILEIIAPLIIIYYFYSNNLESYAYIACISLIIFTIFATIIYHPPDLYNYYKSIPFWANISLIGGLLLLSKQIKL